jgi:hypothetical protein
MRQRARSLGAIGGEIAMKLNIPKVTLTRLPLLINDFSVRLHKTFDHARKNTPEGRIITERLRADARVSAMEGKLLNFGGFQEVFQFESLANWWLWRANEVGSDQADQELEAYLSHDSVEVLGTLWLYGVEVPKSVELGLGVTLVPIDEMPDSPDKEEFLSPRAIFSVPQVPRPRSALVHRLRIGKYGEKGSREAIVQSENLRQAIALILNCLPGVACARGMSTYYIDYYQPPGPFAGRGFSHEMYDFIPYAKTNFPVEESLSVEELIRGYIRLDNYSRERISRALYRLGQSKMHLSDDEKFLDLGIALEMVLLDSENSKKEMPDQLGLTFRLRGSWLISDSAEERVEVMKALRDIYSLRSQVAHGGISPTLAKMDKRSRKEALERNFKIAERIFRQILRSGLPSQEVWSKLILGFAPPHRR